MRKYSRNEQVQSLEEAILHLKLKLIKLQRGQGITWSDTDRIAVGLVLAEAERQAATA